MSRPTFTMLCGLVGSGKSTYASILSAVQNIEVFSSDELRKEMFGDVNEHGKNNELFAELHRRIKDCLKAGKSAIMDSTNISSKKRRAFLQELNKIDCKKRCVIIATPYEQCLENNASRERRVPESVIENMYRHWNTPALFEGWDCIEIVYWYGGYHSKDSYRWAQGHIGFCQCNQHHTMTLGEHCIVTRHNVANRCPNDRNLIFAGYLHDVGKPKVMAFANSKGEPTEYAHFYSHENVGAYDALFFDCGKRQEDILDVSLLINLHMTPYYFERNGGNEKLRNKYKKLWGDELYNRVMILHEADKAAH